MKNLRRIMAIILSVCMILGTYRVDVRADGDNDVTGPEGVATSGDPEMDLASDGEPQGELEDPDESSYIAELTVGDMRFYEGQVRDMERRGWDEESEQDVVIGNYMGYDPSWPGYVKVVLRDDLEDESLRGKEYEGNAGEVFNNMSKDIAEPGSHINFWAEYDQPDVDGYTTWSVGNEYPVTLHVLDATCEYGVYIEENPVALVEVDDIKDVYGDTEQWEWREWNPETEQDDVGTFEAYRVWPNHVKVTLTEKYESKVFENKPENGEDVWAVRDQLADFLQMDRDGFEFGDNGGEQSKDSELWELGSVNPVEFSVLGKKCTYNVNIVENPIASMEQADINHYVGDTVHRDEYNWQDETGKWQREVVDWDEYDVYPHDLTVTLKKEVDGEKSFTGDWWDAKNWLLEKTGIHFDEHVDGNTQTPYEGGTWAVDTYPITFSFGTTSVEYNVNIMENPVESVEVKDFVLIEGDLEEREYGYRDKDTQEDVRINYMGYRTWPEEIKVTLSNGDVLEGNTNDVKRELAAELGLDENRYDFGDDGGGQMPDEWGETTWGVGFLTANFSVLGVKDRYDIDILANHIDSIAQPDITFFAGDKNDRHGYDYYDAEKDRWEHEDVDWTAYDTYPHNLTVSLNKGNYTFTGDWWDAKEKISEYYKEKYNARYDVLISDRIYGDTQTPYDDGQWDIDTYPVEFKLGPATAKYKVKVVDNPIRSVVVPDTIYLVEGDTYTENGRDIDGERKEGEEYRWRRYGYWPQKIIVLFTDEAEEADDKYKHPLELTFDPENNDPREQMIEQFADFMEVNPEDVRFDVWDDQAPDENDITNWKPDTPSSHHTAQGNLAGNEFEVPVVIVPLGIDDVEIPKQYRDCEENDFQYDGYDDPETGEWIPVQFDGYDVTPYQGEKEIYFADGSATTVDDFWYFWDGYLSDLKDEYNIPATYNFGMPVFFLSDQKPDSEETDKTNWKVGRHTATLSMGFLKCDYEVVVTGDMGSFTGLAVNGPTLYSYFVDGIQDDSMNGFIESDVADEVSKVEVISWVEDSYATWFVVGGNIDLSENGPVMGHGEIEGVTAWYKVTGGRYDAEFTGFALGSDGKSWYFEDGAFSAVTGIKVDPEDKAGYYVKDGKKDLTKTGFVVDGDDSWYVVNGKVSDLTENIYKDTDGQWYYINNGKKDLTFTGYATNKNGTYYCKSGVVQFITSIEKDPMDGKWYYINKGKKDSGYTGFASNANGTFYVKAGLVDLKTTSIFKGTINNKTAWYYVKNSKYTPTYNGFASNANGTYYVEDGVVTLTTTSIFKGTINKVEAWYYVSNSKYTPAYTGFAKNNNGIYYVEKGVVSLKKTSIVKGTIDGKEKWYYIKNSKYTPSFTGFAKNERGTFYVTGGYVNLSSTTIVKGTINGKTAWYYIEKGKYNPGFTGIAKNNNGSYLVQKGAVNFNYNGKYTYNGKTYTIKAGKVQ